MKFIEALKKRRSIYKLGKNIEDEAIVVETIKEAVRYSPTAFNSQIGRVVILLKDSHEKLWKEIASQKLHEIFEKYKIPQELEQDHLGSFNSFAEAYGTVLFFEDQAVIKSLQQKYSLYADNFPSWSEQGTGISSANVWTALSELGVGATLQFYNTLIAESVMEEWQFPNNWKLRGQLIFGSKESLPAEKTFIKDEERFWVIH